METFQFKKKFGQNFLKDRRIVSKIADIAGITKDDLVIEVGPGMGILTEELAYRAKHVISYEIDKDLLEPLKNIELRNSNITFIFQDFMNRNIINDISSYTYRNLYFVSNVPYYITTPILMKLMDLDLNFQKIVMMVQKEVGERFSAKPGSKSYGSLTVYLNYFYKIKSEFHVGKNEFIPAPKVDSVVVSFSSKKDLLSLKNKELFFQLVRDSFQFKRKTLKNNLFKYDLKIVENVLIKNGYHLSSRAEQIPVSVFVEISNELSC